MDNKIPPGGISGLSSTLLIPLWAKAVEYGRSDALLRDAEAARMMALIDYDFSKFASAKLSQPGCCGRAAIIDGETRRFTAMHPDAVVVQLGAGLDARFERLGRPAVTAWYDLDLPEVIAVRRKLLPESGNRYLAASMFDGGWIETAAAHQKPVLLLLEGVLMYFSESEVKAFFAAVAKKLPHACVVTDLLGPATVGKAKHHDALKNMENSLRPEFKWAPSPPEVLESWQPGLKIAAKHHLSDVCLRRYPWFARWAFRTKWGRRMLDLKVVRIEFEQAEP